MKIDIRFSVTEAAIAELKKAFPSDPFVRVSARQGCSKVIYDLVVAGATDDEDVLEDISGVKFVTDRKSLMHLDGVTLDWSSDMIVPHEGQNGFFFQIPLQEKHCSNKPSGGCCRKGKCS